MSNYVGRREFILGLGGAAAAWPNAARAQLSAPAQIQTGLVEPLVSVSWLQDRLAADVLVVLDIRSAEDFAKGHIPGAIQAGYDEAGWRMTPAGSSPMSPSVSELEALIGAIGLDADSRVVVVPAGLDATEFGSAARVYWILKVSGIKHVSILDGGFAAWRSAVGTAVETATTQASPTIFTPSIDKSVMVGVDEVEAIARAGGASLVDARPFSFFAGTEKIPAVEASGHIPGALSLDSALFYDANSHRLKTPAELAKIASLIPEGPIVTYCNAGHWAATDWFVLHELLHRANVRLYYGSMIEWASASHRRVESAANDPNTVNAPSTGQYSTRTR